MKSNLFHLIFITISIIILTSLNTKSQTNTDSLIIKLNSNPVDSVKLKILTNLSYAYAITDLKKSFTYANQAIELEKVKGLENELLAAYKVLGKICFEKGLMEEAGKYFILCLEIISKNGNKLQMAMANNNIGATFQSTKKYEIAENYFLKSLQLLKEYSQEKNDTILNPYIINIYNNLAALNKTRGNISKAISNFDLGIKMAENLTEYPNTRVALLQNKGLLLIDQSKFDEANLLIQKSIDIGEKLKFGYGLATSYMFKGELLTKQGKTREALASFQKGYTYASATESHTLIQKLSDQLQLSYKSLGKSDSVFKYLNISIEAGNAMKLQETREVLDANENKKIFASWQKEEADKQKRNTYFNWTIAFISIIAAIIFLGFYLNKRKQHQRVLLENMEKELALQHLELEKKLLETSLGDKEKQLANDVLNQIQKNEIIKEVVSKLLHQTKQATGINKEVVKEAIKDLGRTTEENVWSEFEIRFKKVHANFYDNLQLKFPDLTRNERRLCAFLRLNMSSKEISAISGQSPKTIDVARYRLRKKLGIANDEKGLIAFLNNI